MTLNYLEHFLILASAVIGGDAISAVASLVGITTGIASSAIGLKFCEITARVNPIQDGEEEQKSPLYRFFPSTSTNVEISPQNLLNFSFDPFATLV